MVTLVPTYRMILADLPQFYQNYYNGFGLGQILGFLCLLSLDLSLEYMLKTVFHSEILYVVHSSIFLDTDTLIILRILVFG